jgi:ATP-dependent Clp protease ATP-binding subunit ClpC
MTSNLGSDLIRRETAIGFSINTDEARGEQQAYERMKEKVLDEVKRFFRPEFLNRIDATVVFHALTKDHLLSIVDLMLGMVALQLEEKGIKLETTPEARQLLADEGYDPNFGARPLRRVIQNQVEDRLSDEILSGRIQSGETAVIDVEEGKIAIHTKVVAMSSG